MTTETRNKMQQSLEVYKAQHQMMQGVLGACNYIVEAGPFTIAIENGKPISSPRITPQQFTLSTAKEIAAKIQGSKVVLAKDWYEAQIETLELVLQD